MALRTALGDYPQLKIFGTDYDTPDGTTIRDYILIDDLANAHLLALDYLKTEKKSRVFNCGYGTGSSVSQVVKTAKAVTEIDFPAVPCERRKGDPPALVADSTLIQKELGWEPKVALKEGLVKTIAYFDDFLKR